MQITQVPPIMCSDGGAGPSGTSSETISPPSLDASQASGSNGGSDPPSVPTEYQTDQSLPFFSGLKKSWHDWKHKGHPSQASQEVLREGKHGLAAVFNFSPKKNYIHLPEDDLVISSCYVYDVHNGTGFIDSHPDTNSPSGSIHEHKNAKAMFQKLMGRIKRIPWRKLVWVVVICGVLGGCVGVTVLTHGLAAPLFVLFIAVMDRAEKDIDKHKPAAE